MKQQSDGFVGRLLVETLGDAFVDYLSTIKQAECDRFLSQVTDWEQREYFQTF